MIAVEVTALGGVALGHGGKRSLISPSDIDVECWRQGVGTDRSLLLILSSLGDRQNSCLDLTTGSEDSGRPGGN